MIDLDTDIRNITEFLERSEYRRGFLLAVDALSDAVGALTTEANTASVSADTLRQLVRELYHYADRPLADWVHDPAPARAQRARPPEVPVSAIVHEIAPETAQRRRWHGRLHG
jgi:hypothetical protein